jgi:hypothetical protein
LKKKALGRGAPGIDFCFLAAGSAMIGRVHVAMGESALRRLAELCAQPLERHLSWWIWEILDKYPALLF